MHDEVRREFHAVKLAVLTHALREETHEQPGARPDVGDRHARLQVERLRDPMPVREDLPRLDFEPLLRFRDVQRGDIVVFRFPSENKEYPLFD